MRWDDGTGETRGEARGALGRGTGEAARAQVDVPAVGRVLDRFPADRVTRAQAMDALFTGEPAGRAARFTRSGGRRTRMRLPWWTVRACAGTGRMPFTAALRTGSALGLLRTRTPGHDDVMDGSAPRRGRPALHADLCAPGHACSRSSRSRKATPTRRPARHGARVMASSAPSPLARSGARETAR
ncbi:polyprenyl synthetase family protein [Streptomyces flaveolus]|uniref:polyprenyl synthetase family protein n=1 Tax=Streptomyces flaveolus TaxID=67297 RepID=UPI00341853F9